MISVISTEQMGVEPLGKSEPKTLRYVQETNMNRSIKEKDSIDDEGIYHWNPSESHDHEW